LPVAGSVQGIWQAQQGRPLTIGNVTYNGDITKLKTTVNSSRVSSTVFDISGYLFHSLAAVLSNGVIRSEQAAQRSANPARANYRTLPSRFSWFPGHGAEYGRSESKNFAFTETIRLQLRTEFLNAFNTPFFDNPNLTPNNANFGRAAAGRATRHAMCRLDFGQYSASL
jgi:hypothetical protein